jgi:predicted pyridoxine 5'-phosphate oxidase superfamily flavin-nucleotide-binding protein
VAYDFLDRLSTPGVRAAQAANGAGGLWDRADGHRPLTHFTEREAAFIAARDSFYLASVSQSGWPYIQHRGGPPGFLAVLDATTLGFADYRGNRQYISLGNVADDDRVALFLMDYPGRKRLKVLAHMTPFDLAADPDLAARLGPAGYRAVPERGFKLRLEAFDWNCPQHITPRFTVPEVEEAVAPLRARLASLEAETARLRDATGGAEDHSPGRSLSF